MITLIRWYGNGCTLPGTGRPYNTGCRQLVSVTYEDLNIDICENSWKIRRTWTIIDWCDPNPDNEAHQKNHSNH